MIYIINKYSEMSDHFEVDSVWEVRSEDVQGQYNSFMLDLAAKQEIVVNPHWLNIMNHEDHHPNLTVTKYKQKENKPVRYQTQTGAILTSLLMELDIVHAEHVENGTAKPLEELQENKPKISLAE